MKLFLEEFIKKLWPQTLLFSLLSIVQTLIYILSIILIFGESNLETQVGLLNSLVGYLDNVTYLVIFLFLYVFSSIISFYLQVDIANKFSINLNKDLDKIYDYSAIQSSANITSSTVMKDVTYEFARFGTNLVMPLLEGIKHLISIFLIFFFLFLTFPDLILNVSLIFIPYLLFWYGTKKYFENISIKISSLLNDRQRFADFKYTDINRSFRDSSLSYVDKSFSKVIKSIADLNVISKTIASMPKIILETLILVVALIILSSPDGSGNLTQQIYFLGLSAIRILPGMQGISNSISSFQLNWPALEKYELRRNSVRDFSNQDSINRKASFPEVIENITIKSSLKNIKFNIPNKISFDKSGIILFKGKSGLGKTTFLRILLGLEPSIYESKDLILGNLNTFYLDQHTTLLSGSVRENFQDFNSSEQKKLLKEAYEIFFNESNFKSFEDFLDSPIGLNTGLSGGELNRIKIMKSLFYEARFFIWDEPFDGMQSGLAKQIVNYLKSFKNKTFLIIDHNILEMDSANSIVFFTRDKDAVELNQKFS
jgi:ABC-type bacteriocin/lantibiotic exporter with double-glycine peptidase domain|tara:strand:+ start:277 stop:1899 length:1623 start_codon:yes stop_codon:yes gene_type:complete